MTASLVFHTLRECHRGPLPYLLATAVILMALTSRLFQAFSFGSQGLEAVNLAISAVFLAGFLHAALLGTSLIRRDHERGTLPLLLSKPLYPAAYVAGRLLGLCASGILVCLGVALAVAGLLQLPIGPPVSGSIGQPLAAGCLRAILPVLVLESAAIAISTVASRIAGPVILAALFLAGSLFTGGLAAFVLPDFSLFGLEAGVRPPMGVLALYATCQSAFFALVAYLSFVTRTQLCPKA